MFGSLKPFRNNIGASFGNLSEPQFDALYEEVLKEKAKRLIGEQAAGKDHLFRQVGLTATLYLSSGQCHIHSNTWDLSEKDGNPDYNPQIVRGQDYTVEGRARQAAAWAKQEERAAAYIGSKMAWPGQGNWPGSAARDNGGYGIGSHNTGPR